MQLVGTKRGRCEVSAGFGWREGVSERRRFFASCSGPSDGGLIFPWSTTSRVV
jgi:hypothetical protein